MWRKMWYKREYDPDLDISADMPLEAFMNHSLILKP